MDVVTTGDGAAIGCAQVSANTTLFVGRGASRGSRVSGEPERSIGETERQELQL